jgi:hypothetical protein
VLATAHPDGLTLYPLPGNVGAAVTLILVAGAALSREAEAYRESRSRRRV